MEASRHMTSCSIVAGWFSPTGCIILEMRWRFVCLCDPETVSLLAAFTATLEYNKALHHTISTIASHLIQSYENGAISYYLHIHTQQDPHRSTSHHSSPRCLHSSSPPLRTSSALSAIQSTHFYHADQTLHVLTITALQPSSLNSSRVKVAAV